MEEKVKDEEVVSFMGKVPRGACITVTYSKLAGWQVGDDVCLSLERLIARIQSPSPYIEVLTPESDLQEIVDSRQWGEKSNEVLIRVAPRAPTSASAEMVARWFAGNFGRGIESMRVVQQ